MTYCTYIMYLSNGDISEKSEIGKISYMYTFLFGLWKTLKKPFLPSLALFKPNLVHYITHKAHSEI